MAGLGEVDFHIAVVGGLDHLSESPVRNFGVAHMVIFLELHSLGLLAELYEHHWLAV